MANPFIQSARDELAELQRRREAKQAEIKPLQDELDRIKEEEARLAAYLQIAGVNGDHGETKAKAEIGPKDQRRLKKMGLGEATVFVLGFGDRLKKPELFERLNELGYVIGGTDPKQNLGSTLYNLRQAGKVERDGEGRYYVAQKEAPATT